MKLKLMILSILIFSGLELFSQSPAANQLKEAVAAKDFEAAIKFAPDAVKENPDNREILLLAGDVFVEMDRNDEALNAYQRAYIPIRKIWYPSENMVKVFH